ncbi:MFS family permease [Lipingzhangella halophila]|uniref:MFS family permease n=1 Tax=Lipingzhangella halophila TaxID=1783352 RepID=A0A7W7RIG2_9ACTN|nr:MFS family permease [Lipingzhangella halophila]
MNTSMIALAVVPIERDYGSGMAAATWLISAFYLAATVAMPVMGRLADRFGPRRVFVSGLLLVCVTSALAPLAPNIWWLVAARVVLAIGTSVAFPATMAIFRSALPAGPPQSAMAMVASANSASAAFGPVLGGILVQLWGWQATWLVNVPVTIVGVVLAMVLLPRPAQARGSDTARPPARTILAELDLPGIGVFVLAMGCTVGFLLSTANDPGWLLIPVAVVGAAVLVLRELRVANPFLDLRMLGANRGLLMVFAQNSTINVVFYLGFLGLPQWLQGAREEGAGVSGMLVLPLAGISVLALPLVTRLLRRFDERFVLTAGGLLLLCGSAGLLLVDSSTPLWTLVLLTALLGLPNAFNNLGLQSMMYRAAPTEHIGIASGLFQTFRFIGSIAASVIIGLVFTHGISDAGLTTIAGIMVAMSAAVVLANLRPRR